MAQDDAIAAFNQVLSEVLDMLPVAGQADRKVQWSHPIHAELDLLVQDLRSWAGQLMDRDDALGISALAFMPSKAGRHLPNPWPRDPTDQEVRVLLDELLSRLEEHLEAALAQQCDDGMRGVLAKVEQGLRRHRQALSQA